MNFWNSRHVTKTKKEHRCIYCRCKIKTGSSCWHETGTYDGDFNDYRICERCHHLFTDYRQEFIPDNEIGDFFIDDLQNTDILDCPKCGKQNFREYDFSSDCLSISIECDNCDHKYTVDLSIEGIDKYFSKAEGDSHE